MVLPVGNEAAQQVWSAEERTVGGAGAAHRDVVAATGARMASVQHELLGGETREAGFFVQHTGVRDQLVPRGSWMNIDFDHTRIGRDPEALEPRIGRR